MPASDTKTADINPAIGQWNGPLGLPEFDRIDDNDFKAAFDAALPAHLAEIEAIAENPDAPTFDNTIVALETAGMLLNRTSGIFWNLSGANSNDTLQALERDL